ncbi:MAG: GGDEF domain-containing protein, partial [Myxococcota bacterium]|nr:GGDEF domain-containing protein [Myxococcota bacterium]
GPAVTIVLREQEVGELRLDGAPLPVDNPPTLSAPLRGNGVQGELKVLASTPSLFLEDDGRMLVTVADLLASVVRQARLYSQVLETNARLARLDDISRAINAQQTVDEIIEAAATGLGELVGADAFGLYILTEGIPSLLAWHGAPEVFPQSVEVTGQGGRALLGRPGSQQLQLGSQVIDERIVLVELLRGARSSVLGIVALRLREGQGEVPEELRPLISAVAGHLAIAVDNARRLDEMRRQATFDHLTGLAGKRHFANEMRREIDRARRESRPLAMLMLDADHFKELNDTHGHLAGDAVLKALASALRDGTRSIDVLGRLGGEELGVLLPGAELNIAQTVAERLRASIEALEVEWKGNPVKVTVSIGVAAWHSELEPDDLIEASDMAMYAAKGRGRNQVAVRATMETQESLRVADLRANDEPN